MQKKLLGGPLSPYGGPFPHVGEVGSPFLHVFFLLMGGIFGAFLPLQNILRAPMGWYMYPHISSYIDTQKRDLKIGPQHSTSSLLTEFQYGVAERLASLALPTNYFH